jgi:replication factor C subunit 1
LENDHSQSYAKPTINIQTPPPKKKGRAARRIIDDDSDDDEPVTKPQNATPTKPSPRKRKEPEPEPKGEATTTSSYFGAKGKPKRSEPVKSRANTEKKATDPIPKTNGKTPSTPVSKGSTGKRTSARSSARTQKTVNYTELNDDDFDDDDFGEDIFTADYKKDRHTKGDGYESSEVEDAVVLPHRTPPAKRGQGKFKKEVEDVEMEDATMANDTELPKDEEKVILGKQEKTPKTPVKTTAGTKRKSPETTDQDDAPSKKSKKSQKSPAKRTPSRRTKKEEIEDSADIQAIYDRVQMKAPTPPPQEGSTKKFDFKSHSANTGPAPSQGSKELPTGQPNCLAGLTFVFTGLLPSFQREELQAVVKQYGGKVTGAPSKKTSFVVVGSDAGPKKLQTIKEYNLKAIDEDGFLELLRSLPANGGNSKAAAEYEQKQEKEAQKIRDMAAVMESEERRLGGAGGAGGGKAALKPKSLINNTKQTETDSRLWTVKYAPTQITQICGNKTQVEKLQTWLRNFPKSQRTGFKLAGKDGSGVFRAVIIHGPPGIGKTTAAHLVAKLEGYDVVESNASDTRSKKLVEDGLRGVLSTTSLLGYFAGQGEKVDASKKKLVLIMDEVDGMSAGDRGGVGALAAVCKKTQIPMILICNDRRAPKMKPFTNVAYDLPFRRPTVDQVRSRIMTIGFREGLKLPANVVNALIEGSNADIRQVVNMVSTIKLDQEGMDFDAGKEMSKAWQKHVILKPWDITNKILGGGLFAESSKTTLNEKSELYFNDHELSYLMLAENYLGTNPTKASKYSGRERNLKLLELADNAAGSISDGDLVDRMIHGSQQHWSLMPLHAIFSFVRPASFMAGSLAGHGGAQFPQWMGKNSTAQKNNRLVKEIQGHMRLRSSGDRHEVRQQYIPTLWDRLVRRLEREGGEIVPDIIDLMDSYFLTKEDFDSLVELGVGYMDQENVKIDSKSKATFTRL